MGQPNPSSRNWTVLAVGGIVLALGSGLVAGHFWPNAAPHPDDHAAIEKVVHDYILEHPEILPQAMENLQKKENAQALTGIGDAVHKPYPGAILGNPRGSVTLVEFTDFACTFCRQSVAEVDQLVAANPDLRVVVRELPILSPQSADAAKMALAAAEQGKYAAFHRAMFAAGRPAPDTIAAAAQAAGLDMDRARKTIAAPRVEAELTRNVDFARQLGFNGTPSWIAGDTLLSGAVGEDKLSEAIAAARKG
jgi:protein-disulfide isomerase